MFVVFDSERQTLLDGYNTAQQCLLHSERQTLLGGYRFETKGFSSCNDDDWGDNVTFFQIQVMQKKNYPLLKRAYAL
jgi:hypothetical protein